MFKQLIELEDRIMDAADSSFSVAVIVFTVMSLALAVFGGAVLTVCLGM